MSHEETESVGVLNERLKNAIRAIEGLTEKLEEMEDRFVTRKEFTPIQKLVYGGVAIVLSGVLGAVLSLVFVHAK